MKFILPILYLTATVLGYSSYNYYDLPEEVILNSTSEVHDLVSVNPYELVLNAVYDTLEQQVNLVLEETLKNTGFSIVMDHEYHGICWILPCFTLSYQNNIKIEMNKDIFNISYCFKSSNCTDYNQLSISEIVESNHDGFQINHNGNFGNLGQDDINYDSFDAVSKFYTDNEKIVRYESNNTYMGTNGTEETLNGFIQLYVDVHDNTLATIEVGITECTDAFQNLDICPFKSAKLSMETHRDATIEGDDKTDNDSDDTDNESGSGNSTYDYIIPEITVRSTVVRFTVEIDDNEIPYSPVVIGKRRTFTDEQPFSYRIQIPNLITFNLAGKGYKDDNNNQISKIYSWASEKVTDVIFFPFDKDFPLHVLTLNSDGNINPAIGNFFSKGNIWNGIFGAITPHYQDHWRGIYNSILIGLNMDELYNKMKENDSFDISGIIKASEFDSGLLYILGHENYIWYDENFSISNSSNEGHLNDALCELAKDFNDKVLKDMYYIGESAKDFREKVAVGFSDKFYYENSS